MYTSCVLEKEKEKEKQRLKKYDVGKQYILCIKNNFREKNHDKVGKVSVR